MVDAVAIGVDIGGTFTDLVGLRSGHSLLAEKVPSTPEDPVAAVFSGLERLISRVGRGSVSFFAHGTTVATNAVLERKGARIGLLTTCGFEDALEIGRLERSNIYDLFLGPETPTFVAPKRFRIGIAERVDASGKVVTPLDEAEVDRAIITLRERSGVEAVAVCYLFSFKNPIHEQVTRTIIHRRYPDLPVSLSSEIDPRFREYERLCTTVFDAYLRPVVTGYLRRLDAGLRRTGIRSRLFLMQSNGGLYTGEAAIERPVSMLKSGLAAGVNGATEVAKRAGYSDVITIDIGGTSCDVALVRDGRPVIREESRLQTYPLRVPMVDVSTIGAGGGSIAWLDAAGGLHVGPHSAGADPGPACYGRGGAAPTVTDASLVLGYLNPRYFAGGRLTLHEEAAHRAIAKLAGPLRFSVSETAYGIHRIVNAAMANEVRKVSLERGHDPRHFALLVLGGAGPVHGCSVARELKITTVIVPELPGLLCAYGLLVSNVTRDHVEAYHASTRQLDSGKLARRCREIDQVGRVALARDGATHDDVTALYAAQMRYRGQSYELDVSFAVDSEDNLIGKLVSAFHARHKDVYGRCNTEREVEIVSFKVTHLWSHARPDECHPHVQASIDAARKGIRPVYFRERNGYQDTPVYDRTMLPVGVLLVGPAIVEQADTTTVIGYGQSARVNAQGHLIISLEA